MKGAPSSTVVKNKRTDLNMSITPDIYPVNTLLQLEEWARCFAEIVKPGDIITLDGPLGAGKTTLAQYLGKFWGLEDLMTSPTYALIHEYETLRFPLFHIDCYRLGPAHADSLAEELGDVLAAGQSVFLVEWAAYSTFFSEAATHRISLNLDINLDNLAAASDTPPTETRTLHWVHVNTHSN